MIMESGALDASRVLTQRHLESYWSPSRQCQRSTFNPLTFPLLDFLIYFYSKSFINAVVSPVLSTCPSTVIKH